MKNNELHNYINEIFNNKNQSNLLLKHLNLVINKNKDINLTRIEDINSGKILHIEDSIIVIPYILRNLSNINDINYADIGSGAGYPGIPLHILSDFNTYLIETKSKKAECLKEFVKELNLNNIYILNNRIENIAKDNIRFDLVTARALSSVSSLLELASPLLKINGVLACYKAIDCDEEIKEADNASKITGMKLVNDYKYVLSDNKTNRRLLIYKKINKPSIKLPRKLGKAQKYPL